MSAVFTFADTSFATSQKRAPITKERLFVSTSFISDFSVNKGTFLFIFLYFFTIIFYIIKEIVFFTR